MWGVWLFQDKEKEIQTMKTQQELIKFYEKRLENVLKQFSDSSHQSYIQTAVINLEEVKKGRGW